MSVRPPQSFTGAAPANSPLSALEYELMAERADSLGRAGLKVEAMLERLRLASDEAREECLFDAAEAVQALFVQREVCGLRVGRDVVARYGIPGAVLARLGVRRPARPA
jgi:hypothetical protein